MKCGKFLCFVLSAALLSDTLPGVLAYGQAQGSAGEAFAEEAYIEEKEEGDFTYAILSDGTAEITGYQGDSALAAVPDTVGGVPVSGIGKRAFADRGLAGLSIPEGIARIGEEAFAENPLLYGAVLPEGLKEVESRAFAGCESLQLVKLPQSLSGIGEQAFDGCGNPTFWVRPGSYGESYAQAIGAPCAYPAQGCAHTYLASDIRKPGCASEGLRAYACSGCGDAYAEAVPPLGHSYVQEPGKGEEVSYVCAVCGDAYTKSLSGSGAADLEEAEAFGETGGRDFFKQPNSAGAFREYRMAEGGGESSPATQISISGASASMRPGSQMQLKVSGNGQVEGEIQWSTSNRKVASISQSGEAFAWQAGSVDITAKTQAGLMAQCRITVSGSPVVSAPKANSVKLSGAESNNRSKNDYEAYYARVVNSYLSENKDGTFDRIENINRSQGMYAQAEKVVVETYDSKTKKLKKKKEIPTELTFFGGFYSGAEHNYLVYGKGNTKEDDTAEILRVVKYTKGWKRLGSVSAYGANTATPFHAGSLRMAEVGGSLYIHTCHLMYRSEDGLRHQANMTFVVDTDKMEVTQSFTQIANNHLGYAAHSFNQFVQTDGAYVYRVDHGDGAPRGTMISRCEASGRIVDVEWTYPMRFGGNWGQNSTGAAIGGFELSSDSCLIAGNSVPQGKDYQGTSGQRNIFVTVTDKGLEKSSIVWITKYTGGQTEVKPPHLVKIGADQFLLMWEEKDGKTGKKATKLATLDGGAQLTSSIVTCKLPLSDCKPVVFQNGQVQWYVTENGKPVLYAVSPYDLKAAKAIPVEKIAISGASKQIAAGKKLKLTAKVTPKNAANPSVKWTSSNTKVATVSQSGLVTLKKGSGGKTVKITAAAQDGSGAKASYKISSKKGIVKKVSISGKKSVKAGKSLQLKGKVTASKGANKALAWKSSNTKYATVSSAGKVKAKAAGKGKKVKITAQATDGSGKKKTITVKIT